MEQKPCEGVPVPSTYVLGVLAQPDPCLLSCLHADDGKAGGLLVRPLRQHVGVAPRHRSSLQQNVGLLCRSTLSHAGDQQQVRARHRGREDAAARVVSIADVGDGGVVDYGALRGHVEGVGGMIGVKGHVRLCCTCCKRDGL